MSVWDQFIVDFSRKEHTLMGQKKSPIDRRCFGHFFKYLSVFFVFKIIFCDFFILNLYYLLFLMIFYFITLILF